MYSICIRTYIHTYQYPYTVPHTRIIVVDRQSAIHYSNIDAPPTSEKSSLQHCTCCNIFSDDDLIAIHCIYAVASSHTMTIIVCNLNQILIDIASSLLLFSKANWLQLSEFAAATPTRSWLSSEGDIHLAQITSGLKNLKIWKKWWNKGKMRAFSLLVDIWSTFGRLSWKWSTRPKVAWSGRLWST